MDNILKYLNWRGDMTFQERPFNELDALVCALLGYIEWDGIVSKEPVLLEEACQRYYEAHDEKEMMTTYAYSPMLVDLIQVLQNTPRFKNVKLKNYTSVLDTTKSIQFAAVTIMLPNDVIYISYRGTDSSILGWKEDFEMIYQDDIPSQQMALDYLEKTYPDMMTKKGLFGLKTQKKPTIYLGGHSKGGNIAMYAAICSDKMKDNISHVYSFDGPGFRKEFYDHYDCSSMLDKITNYTPVSSIIGRLMEHQERYLIFDGYASGLQQHDGFYWKVEKDCFSYVESFDSDSDKIHQYIESVLSTKTNEEKKTFIDFIFKVLHDMKVNHITDFTEIGLKEGLQGIKELSNMSQDERKFFFEIVKLAFTQTKSILSVMTNMTKKDI